MVYFIFFFYYFCNHVRLCLFFVCKLYCVCICLGIGFIVYKCIYLSYARIVFLFICLCIFFHIQKRLLFCHMHERVLCRMYVFFLCLYVYFLFVCSSVVVSFALYFFCMCKNIVYFTIASVGFVFLYA